MKAEKLDAEGLTEYILTTLRKHQLDPNCIISQGYDGASVMAGNFSGVQAWIKHVIPSAIYIHCHAHVLNLCLVDSTKAVRYSGEFFALLESLYIFLSSSNLSVIPYSLSSKESYIQVNRFSSCKDYLIQGGHVEQVL